jgi:quercetin dioxygenase-like cupin family protein
LTPRYNLEHAGAVCAAASGANAACRRTRAMKKTVWTWYSLAVWLASGCGTYQAESPAPTSHADEPAGKIQVQVLAKSGISWDGESLPAYPSGRPEVTILKIVIPPGATLPMHKHSVINAGILMRGALRVRTEGGKTLHLKTGEALVEVTNTWHYGKNEGIEPAEILVFYSGIAGAPITLYKSD